MFESRDSARAYKRAHGLEGNIRKQSDGSWAIENKDDHSFITKDAELGVITAALAAAPKDGYHDSQSLLYSAERRAPYTGFLGGLEYLLTGGNENGLHYNRDGYPTGLAPLMGEPLGGGKGKAVAQGVKSAAKAGITFLNPAPARLMQKGLEHIIARHWFTSGAKGAGKFV